MSKKKNEVKSKPIKLNKQLKKNIERIAKIEGKEPQELIDNLVYMYMKENDYYFEDEYKTKKVNCYLTETEFSKLQFRLRDHKDIESLLREIVVNYIGKGF